MKTALPVLGVIGVLALGTALAAMSTYNGLNSQEKGVTATWRDSAVQYDNFWKKVKETAQVPEKYKDAFKDVLLSTTEARYEGKDPAFQMIMEANPQLDPAMYIQVQRVIEAGRNDFAATQRTLVDRQRAYDTALTSFPNNLFVGFFGFPREVSGEYRPMKDLDGDGKYTVLDYPTVTSGKTQEVFTTGREDVELNVFGDGSL